MKIAPSLREKWCAARDHEIDICWSCAELGGLGSFLYVPVGLGASRVCRLPFFRQSAIMFAGGSLCLELQPGASSCGRKLNLEYNTR